MKKSVTTLKMEKSNFSITLFFFQTKSMPLGIWQRFRVAQLAVVSNKCRLPYFNIMPVAPCRYMQRALETRARP